MHNQMRSDIIRKPADSVLDGEIATVNCSEFASMTRRALFSTVSAQLPTSRHTTISIMRNRSRDCEYRRGELSKEAALGAEHDTSPREVYTAVPS